MSASPFESLWGPVLGLVAGVYLTQAVGWRWISWVNTIAVCHPCEDTGKRIYTHVPQSRAVSLITAVLMRETYVILLILLNRKAKRLRKSTGDLPLRMEPPASAPASVGKLSWRAVTVPNHRKRFCSHQ